MCEATIQNTHKTMGIGSALILGFVGFMTSFGAHVVAVNLPLYAERVGIGTAMIGLLIAAYDLAEIVGKPGFGALADRRGMKRTMLVGIVVFTFASLLYLFVDPRWLLLIRFLQGTGAAGLSAVSLALIGVYYPENRGTAYGVYNATKGAGYVVSPLLGGLIILRTNFAAIFIATASLGVVAFLISLTLPNARTQTEALDPKDDDDFSFRSFTRVFKNPMLAKWYAVIVVNMFFVSILFGFLPVYIHSLGYKPLESGAILSLAALSYLLVQPLAGRWADATDAVATVRVSLLLAAGGLIVTPFLRGPALVVAAMFSGAGIGTVWTNSDAVVSKLAKAGNLGATMGAAGSFKEFGDMVGPVLIGALSQAFGLRIGFVACGVVGLMLFPFIFRNTETSPLNVKAGHKTSM